MAMTTHTHGTSKPEPPQADKHIYVHTHTHTHAHKVAHRLAQSALVWRNTGLMQHSLCWAAGNSGSGRSPSCCAPTSCAAPSAQAYYLFLLPPKLVSACKSFLTHEALQNTLVVTTIYPCIAGKRDNREAFGFYGRFPCSSPPHGLCKELIWNSVIVSLSRSLPLSVSRCKILHCQ